MALVVRRDPDKAYVDTWLWIPRAFVNEDGLKKSLTHTLVDRYSESMKVLELYREAPNHILVPRAFWDLSAIPYEVVDCRPLHFTKVDFTSRIQLDHRLQERNGALYLLPTGDDIQHKSLEALKGNMGGVLQLGCGKGKTLIALQHIAESKVPALVMVDNTQLLEQWLGEIERFLDVPGGIGVVGEGRKEWKKGLVLGTYQTMANWSTTMPEEVRRWFGGIYWDEGHHLSAPIFCKTAPLFYGKRYCLTATPERVDGLHIIADMHVGRVLYKDLTQPLKARIIFYWTGLELDPTDPECDVRDKTNEIHISKVFQYFGKWKPRLWRILQDCIDAVQTKRKVLVVGSSVNEVVNLMAMWTRGATTPLITDIPYPLPQDVKETLTPLELTKPKADKLSHGINSLKKRIAKAKEDSTFPAQRLQTMEDELASLQEDWKRYLVYKKLESENEKRRRKYVKDLIIEPSSAGLMTYGVPAKMRQHFVQTRDVTFAIMKYGKEGLDAPHLDTILVSTPFSQKGSLQQLMGRITGRPLPGKKACMVVFYRDNIGVMHGMCEKLERHMRGWPVDEGGPLDYEHLNNPERARWQKTADLKTAFGQ